MSSTFLLHTGAACRFDTFWDEGDRSFGRCFPAGTGQPLLAVWPSTEEPCPVTLSKLTHEFQLRSVLDPAWAVQPLELRRASGTAALFFADPGGEPLSRATGSALALGEFFDLAIAMVTAVGHLHRSGLVHKDLKPGHFLVAPSRAQVWLTGFGNAVPIPRASHEPATVSDIVGTLAYMSPEQTGRMNRPVDTRSDLYSLGVTMYQMLTGVLPFDASEPKDWVHSHLARQPASPAERVPGTPAAVSGLVMKLLAKSPDERYQTAVGLRADLQQCHRQWQASGEIQDFPLGRHDLNGVLAFPDRLYGREKESATLLDAWTRVAETGRNELVLVSGYSGAGKTSIVNLLRRTTAARSRAFAAGKVEVHEKKIPFATLARALESVLDLSVTMPAGGPAGWPETLASAVAADGALLAPLLPGLERILGPFPAVRDLRPGEGERRLRDALEALVAAMATQSAPLTIFLDDVQWLDEETITFVRGLIAGHRCTGLLVVCAYRGNEVDAEHPLLASASTLRDAGHRVSAIELADLDETSLAALLGDTLRCAARDSAPLARLVKERTAGNPFFAIQFLTELAEEGLLRLDHDSGRWNWSLDQIQSKGFTDNVVELMLGRIGRLRSETREALQLLACLGNETTLANLDRVWSGHRPGQPVEPFLWDAVGAGLVIRKDQVFRFRHDRIHEVVYARIPEAERLQLHLRIGRELASTVRRDALDDNIFVIVEQFNHGAALVGTAVEKKRLAELNLFAALRAKAVSAYSTAHQYLCKAATILGAEADPPRHELAFLVAQHLAECEFHTGRLEPAERRLAHLAQTAADIRQLAVVTQLQLELLLTVGRREEAVSTGLRYLARAGAHWSAQPSDDAVKQEEAAMWRQVGDSPIAELAGHRAMVDPEVLGTMRVLVALMQPAWYSDDNLRKLVILRMVNLSLAHGNSDESAMVYGWLSMLLVSEPDGAAAAREFGQVALALAGRKGNDRYAARVLQIMGGNVLHWSEPLPVARGVLERALKTTEATRNLTYAAYIHSNRMTHGLAQGEGLASVQAAMEQGSASTWGSRYALVKDRIAPGLQLVRTLRGETPVFGVLDANEFDEAAFEAYLDGDVGLLLAACWYWIRKLQARFLAGDHAAAVECAAKARALMWTSPAYFEQAEYHFYAALAIASNGDTEEGNGYRLAAVSAHHRQLLAWAERCPGTFGCRAALVGAEVARLGGRDAEAMHGYEAAITAARDNDFIHVRAIANELAARFYLRNGLEKASRGYLLEARYCYAYWGADAKVWQIDALHPNLAGESRPVHRSGTIVTPIKHLDLATVMAVSQAVSGETSLDRLVEMLMRTAIQQAGASRGVLILSWEDGHRAVTNARVEGQDIAVDHQRRAPGPDDVPLSLIRQVIDDGAHTVIDDAVVPLVTASDPYFQRRKVRSVLCLPLLNQAKLVGALYLENDLAPRVFVPARTEIIKLLAFQAATALENSRLYEERRLADDALRQAQAELAHVSRVMTMNALASSIAHEVSQPLAAVVASAQAGVRWLDRETPNLAEAHDALTAIVAQGQRASEVIAGMRSMLKKTSGERALLDIDSVITQTLRLIEGEASRHGCRIDMRLSGRLPQIAADKVQLQQVILNLAMNGMEAMLDVDPPLRVLSVGTEAGADSVLVTVSDIGPGLRDDARERLFDPFFTTKAEGLGMGLSICLSIVESHGGRLWAEARQPQGTSLRFSLPWNQDASTGR